MQTTHHISLINTPTNTRKPSTVVSTGGWEQLSLVCPELYGVGMCRYSVTHVSGNGRDGCVYADVISYFKNDMKRTNYKLTIDNPCTESWTSMTLSDKGRFCSNCSKNVIDFSALTDNQIIRLIENSSGKLCGRLNKNQVDRIMEVQNRYNFGTKIYNLLAGLLLLSPIDNLLAQTTIEKNKTVLKTDNFSKENVSTITRTDDNTTKDSLKNFIKGKVFDSETKEPLAGASIMIKGQDIGTTADMNGIFTFNIPENLIADQIVFKVLYVGFEPNEFIVYKKDLPMDTEFLMLPSTTSLMGEVCVIKTKRKWWQRKKKSN